MADEYTDQGLVNRFKDYHDRLYEAGAWSPEALHIFLNREGISDDIIQKDNADFEERMLGSSAGAGGRPVTAGPGAIDRVTETDDLWSGIKSLFLDLVDTGNPQ
jgi:hypothetical protein